MFKTLFATLLLSTSIATPTLKADVLQLKKAINVDSQIYGSYNLVDSFDDLFDYFNEHHADDDFPTTFTWTINDSSFQSLVPICFNDSQFKAYSGYLKNISFDFEYGYLGDDTYVRLYGYYDTLMASEFFEFYIYEGMSLSDVDCPAMIFSSYDIYFLDDIEMQLFNYIFTHDDNSYTTTYNGYYTFTSNSLTFDRIFVTGNTLFSQSLYFGFDNWFYPNDNKELLFNYYNVENGGMSFTYFDYPFVDNQVNTSSNLLISNGKMTKSCYSYMSSVGIFAYVHDNTYDNATFKDLLFSIMDSPLYMITQLLSFELFGVNMFVALTGLLTIIVLLILIRKFW